MTTTWLVDTSAYSRLLDSKELEQWMERVDRGLVHIAAATRFEVGFGMRDLVSLEAEERSLLGRLVPEYSTPWIEDRAVEVQRELTRRGHHRAPSVPDLLVAASAEAAGHTVLHVDKDFDLIAAVTGQPVERLR